MTQAKSKTTTEPVAAPVKPEATEAPKPQQQPARQPAQIQVSDANCRGAYANFCRVTGTPEEIIVDFGLNPQPVSTPTEPIVVDSRIVMNYFTAKRLLHALHLSVQRHESVFGVLETDVQKRVQRPIEQPKLVTEQKNK